MKIGFIIPILNDYDVEKNYSTISKACHSLKMPFDVIFALNGKLDAIFTKIRSKFIDAENVKALKTDLEVNQHKLITIAMKYAEDYDAVIIYSGKEDIDGDVVKSFLNSWKSGNKIVYLKKEYVGFKKFWNRVNTFFYNLGIKMLHIFSDVGAENDTQLLDNEVVKTINQLPNKNRQLRVLDSFVGYKSDIIYVPATAIKTDRLYDDKSKSYYATMVTSYGALSLSILCLIFLILGASFSWNMGVFGYLFLFIGFCILLVVSLVYATRTVLIRRVGEGVDAFEIKCLVDKLEKYNFTPNMK